MITGKTKDEIIDEKRRSYINKMIIDELKDEKKRKSRIDKLKKIMENAKE